MTVLVMKTVTSEFLFQKYCHIYVWEKKVDHLSDRKHVRVSLLLATWTDNVLNRKTLGFPFDGRLDLFLPR